MRTYDSVTIRTSGTFLKNELERLDQTINVPLVAISWPRDIQLREDVTMGDEASSFTNTSFAAAGINGTGKSWVGKSSTAIQGVDLEIGKTPHPLHLWARELSWTLPELLSAQQLGRPIDTQKYDALQLKYQMDVDEQVYIGDNVVKAYGLLNNPNIPPYAMTSNWSTASADDILADINAFLAYAWARSGYTVVPDQLRLAPEKIAMLMRPVSLAGSISILKYVSEMCLSATENGRPLDIRSLKWASKRGVGGHDRAMAYTRDKKYIRLPLVPLQKTPLEHRGIAQLTTYFGKIGEVEFVYPETVSYADMP